MKSKKLTIERNIQAESLRAFPYVGNSIASLLRRGVNEDQIVKIADPLHRHLDLIDSLLSSSVGHPKAEPFSSSPSPSLSVSSTKTQEDNMDPVIKQTEGDHRDQNVKDESNAVEDDVGRAEGNLLAWKPTYATTDHESNDD